MILIRRYLFTTSIKVKYVSMLCWLSGFSTQTKAYLFVKYALYLFSLGEVDISV